MDGGTQAAVGAGRDTGLRNRLMFHGTGEVPPRGGRPVAGRHLAVASRALAPTARARMMPPMSEGNGTGGAGLEADLRAVAERQDRAAFGRLFAFYGPRVKAYLRRLGAEDAAAEDMTQEVMLTVWRRAHQFDRARAALSTWIFTIARNKRIDAIRRDRRPDYDPDDPALLEEPDASPRGDEVVEAAQMRRIVLGAVDQLPAEQADLLRIFYYEEKSHSVIAEELGLPLGTVKSRLRLAIGKLRVMMGVGGDA